MTGRAPPTSAEKRACPALNVMMPVYRLVTEAIKTADFLGDLLDRVRQREPLDHQAMAERVTILLEEAQEELLIALAEADRARMTARVRVPGSSAQRRRGPAWHRVEAVDEAAAPQPAPVPAPAPMGANVIPFPTRSRTR